jgi:hypothetical protein
LDAQAPRGEQARLPDRSTADDQHSILGTRLTSTYRVVADRHRLHQGAQLLRHVLGKGHDVRGWYGDPVSESRRDLWRDA